MHLHGFYFTVQRLGDGRRDEPVAGAEGRARRHAAAAGRRHDGDELDAGARGQLAVPLPRHDHVSPERRLARRGTRPADAAGTTRQHAGHGPHGHDRDDGARSAWPAWCSASRCATAPTRRRRAAGADRRHRAQLTMTIRGAVGGRRARRPASTSARRRRVAAGAAVGLAGTAARPAARRAGRDHARQPPRRVDVDSLARPRARQLLRRRARLERRSARRSRR